MPGKGTTIGESTEPLRQLVAGFLERYPAARPRDVYVLLASGTLGPGEPPELEARLAAAAAAAPTAASTGLVIEPVSITGELVRVNLGPALAAGHDLDTLLEASRVAARTFRPRRDLLFTLWAGFVHMNRRHEFHFPRDEIDHFEMTIASAGYPMIEHSPDYQHSCSPCYLLTLGDVA